MIVVWNSWVMDAAYDFLLIGTTAKSPTREKKRKGLDEEDEEAHGEREGPERRWRGRHSWMLTHRGTYRTVS